MNPVSLDPSFAEDLGDGQFHWFFDSEMTDTIHHGLLRDEVMYEITHEGELTMTGLKFRDEFDPYRFYLNWTPVDGCSPNSAKEVNLSSIARILSATLTDFLAESTSAGEVAISWDISGLAMDDTVTLQRAGSDLQFYEIARFGLMEASEYQFVDSLPLAGYNYYRLEIVSNNEISLTSEVRGVSVTHDRTVFGVYPNQFEQYVSLSYNREEATDTEILLYSGQGRLLRRENFRFSGRDNVFSLEGLHPLAPGNYFLVVASSQIKASFQLIKK